MSRAEQQLTLLYAPRRSRTAWLVVLFILLPTLAASLYYGFVATDVFVSEAKLTVRSLDSSSGASASVLTAVLGGLVSTGAGSEDSFIVEEYIYSRSILQDLEERLALRDRYTAPNGDPLSRLETGATREEFHDYYVNNIVTVTYDESRRITTLEVMAYKPEDAKLIADTIIQLTEAVINEISEKSRADALQYAELDVKRAEERLAASRRQTLAFRQSEGDIDPTSSAEAIGELIAQLETNLAESRAELAQSMSFLRPDNPKVMTLKARINALEEQVAKEKGRLAGSQSDNYTQRVGTYADLLLEEEFAQNAYTATIAALEAARAEAQRKHRYLEAFVEPSLPEEALLPERGKGVLTVFLVCVVGFGIGALVLAAIREHARV
ncbi:MAG: hypothetical protein ACPGO3_02095 [Magnetospiraceae bacterium]